MPSRFSVGATGSGGLSVGGDGALRGLEHSSFYVRRAVFGHFPVRWLTATAG